MVCFNFVFVKSKHIIIARFMQSAAKQLPGRRSPVLVVPITYNPITKNMFREEASFTS
jgi:hypothetical protein